MTVTALLWVATAAATPPCLGQLSFVRVGDRDGFGLGDGLGLLNFQGDAVNVDGAGILGPNDFLPDWNQDGLVQHFQGDDFDQRTSGEVGGTDVETDGFANVASTGAQFTDLSLSQSYDATFGTPNDFPDPPSTDRNDALFIFEFTIPADQIDPCSDVFFNIVFGDIGALPADLILTFADMSTVTESIAPINPDVEDGLIKSAFLQLDFADVLQLDGASYSGFLQARLVTRPTTMDGDPYYAVDYAELSTISIASCIGDTDLDGMVGVLDLLDLLASWGPCPDLCELGCRRADADDNAVIDVVDLLNLLAAWGPCT
jgi:hypothetical protein